MKKKINFPLAIIFIVLCGALLVVVVLQYGFDIKISSFIPLDKKSEEFPFLGSLDEPSDQMIENEVIGWEEGLKEDFIEENEREALFLKDGDVWVINKDLDKKYKLIDVEKDIIYFTISPDGKEFYWHNGEEIWKRDINVSDYLLVKADEISEDHKELLRESFEKYKKSFEDFDIEEELKKIKGGIINFYLSPNGEYIAFDQIESYGGCCGGPPNNPIGGIFIIKNDGTEKIKIERPPQALEWRGVMSFWVWSSEDKIIFSLRDMDENFGSIYEVGTNGKFTDGFPLEEFYSPDGTNLVYLEGQEKIKLKDIETGEIKTILESKSLPIPYSWFRLISKIVTWSEDGSFLLVKENNNVFVFDKDGNRIDELSFNSNYISEAILSPENKYIAGLYMKDKYKTSVIFFKNLLTQEIKEIELPETQVDFIFFPNDNRFYYLTEMKESKYELWVIDTETWNKNKLLEDVANIVEIF